MSYTNLNFKTKKALKEALAAGKEVRCFQPGLGPSLATFTGKVWLEGPHYPAPHSWYAEGWMEDGKLLKVK